ncbi:two-component sensor histidine kinase [Paenibacillus sp. J31TS4]|uniref:sensor histidine kinase n=1 Tax=Paenibacillus sp. J31TS4 TaxID=2807195 RepID=UPI001B09963B|nr:HAMP domain-containing sensor histidine kinase [Paenibacillus sp. J31TS4]GIP38735.1 two-component sensor histidine kinase [Paenibacillus sp. J31TS4]
MSIRSRLTLWYSGVLALTLLLFGVALYFFLYFLYMDGEKGKLQEQAESTVSRIRQEVYLSRQSGGPVTKLQPDDSDLRNNNTFLQLTELSTGYVTRSDLLLRTKLRFALSDADLKTAQQGKVLFHQIKLGGVDMLVYHLPIMTEDGQLVAILQVGTYIGNILSLFDKLRLTLLLTALAAVLLAATLGWFLSRKALRPIENVTDAAASIQNGEDLSMRIAYDGPQDEIGRLTDTINSMLARLQIVYQELDEAYRAQRRFVSDASHELRTPLTTIRGNVDLLEKMWSRLRDDREPGDEGHMELSLEAMRDIAGEAARMSRLVNSLLSLARADAGTVMEKTPLELKPVVEEVIRKANLLPRSAEWRTGDLSFLDSVRILANRDYLQQLFFIFIENAFKYTPDGSVTIDALRANGLVGIRIADTGIGMNKEEVPHIFERFYRADESRGVTPGTGLGLSIAKWILDEHGGSVEVTTREQEGTTFLVWLPVFQPDALPMTAGEPEREAPAKLAPPARAGLRAPSNGEAGGNADRKEEEGRGPDVSPSREE